MAEHCHHDICDGEPSCLLPDPPPPAPTQRCEVCGFAMDSDELREADDATALVCLDVWGCGHRAGYVMGARVARRTDQRAQAALDWLHDEAFPHDPRAQGALRALLEQRPWEAQS